jgi:membrane protease YdiL (CAAX protease family)
VEPGAQWETPARPASPVRWGIGDFFYVYFAGLLASAVGAAVGAVLSDQQPDDPTTALTLGCAIAALYGAYTAVLFLISRLKGRGSLRADFGVAVQARYWWALLAGFALQFVLGALVLPLITLVDNEKQSVVEELKDSSGAKLAVLILTAGLLAPVFEEILFRGLLLRSLRRRLSVEWAIAIQALVFSVAHLTDPSLGTLAVVPALFALGAISGIAAVRTGDLSISIPLHVGFNLVTVLVLR